MTEFQRQAITLLQQILDGGGGGGGGGSGDMLSTNNLSDVASVPSSRTNLGVPAATVAAKYRIKTDGTVQLYNATTSKFHTLTLSGADGAVVINIAAGEA